MSNITVPVTPGLWVKTAKQIAEHRAELVEEQDGLDPILKEPLKKPCLDHDHFDGRCRGVLSQSTNTFEGFVLKAWMKYVSPYTETSLSQALRNMADYLEVDGSQNKLHGSYLADMTKFLKRVSKETVKTRALKDLGLVIPEDKDKTERIRLYLEAFIERAEEYRYE